MAYNNINKLRLISDIQDIYNQHKEIDVPTTVIFRKYIEPVYHISYSTLYNYLSVPAKKLLREHEELNPQITTK